MEKLFPISFILSFIFILSTVNAFSGSDINTVYFTSSTENAHSMLSLIQDLKLHLEPVLSKSLSTRNIGPNLALGKTTITSSVAPSGALIENLTDGFTDISLENNRRAIFLKGTGSNQKSGQWIQLDIGELISISRINIRRIYDTTVVSKDVVVQISKDNVAWTTIFNNDADNSMGLGAGTDAEYNENPNGKDIILSTPRDARYIRSWSNVTYGSNLNPYTELEVYGNYLSNTISNGIILRVEPNNAELANKKEGAFKISTDSSGITITGKTTISVMNGVYTLLEKLGYRWYWADPAWHIKPSSLSNIDINEIQEPFFAERGMRFAASEWGQEQGGQQKGINWFTRNKMVNDKNHYVTHTYSSFAERYSVNESDPSAVCIRTQSDCSTKIYPIPDHLVVINRAINHARDKLDDPNIVQFGNVVERIAVPISPDDNILDWCDIWKTPVFNSDGSPKLRSNGCPVLSSSQQVITDHVFNLTNQVAKTLKNEFPGKYISVYSYSVYPELPSFDLENNVYVSVALGIGSRSQTLTDEERIRGFKAMGVKVGTHDYYDVWQYENDRIPAANVLKKKIASIDMSKDAGADHFYTEVTDNWGPKGRLYWIAAKKMWDPSLTYDNLLDEFYTNSFGPAKEPMKKYYTRFDTQWVTNNVLNTNHPITGLAFRDLNDALQLSSGRSDVQERIWQVFYHTYFWWKWGDAQRAKDTSGNNYVFEDVNDAKNFYAFLSRVSTFHIISTRDYMDDSSPLIKSRYGLTDADLTLLQNKARPTLSESQQWLTEALNNWAGIDLIDASAYSLDDSKLAAANSDLPKQNAYFQGMKNFYITLPSSGNEIIDVELTTHGNSASLEFVAPNGVVIDTKDITKDDCYRFDKPLCKWQIRTTTPGIYGIRVLQGYVSIGFNHPAAVDLTKGDEQVPNLGLADGMNGIDKRGVILYFHVPSGTESFVMTTSSVKNMNIKIISPDGTSYSLTGNNGFRNPVAGFWRLNISRTDISNEADLVMVGIPPLLWHDPKYLLAPENALLKASLLAHRLRTNVIVGGPDVTIEIPFIFYDKSLQTYSIPKPIWSKFQNLRLNVTSSTITTNSTHITIGNINPNNPLAMLFEISPPTKVETESIKNSTFYRKDLTITSPDSLTNVSATIDVNISYNFYRLYQLQGSSWVDVTSMYKLDINNNKATFYGFSLSDQQFRLEGSTSPPPYATPATPPSPGPSPSPAPSPTYSSPYSTPSGGTFIPTDDPIENPIAPPDEETPQFIPEQQGDVQMELTLANRVESGETFDATVKLLSPITGTYTLSMQDIQQQVELTANEEKIITVPITAPDGSGEFTVVSSIGGTITSKNISLDYKPLVLSVTNVENGNETFLQVTVRNYEDLSTELRIVRDGSSDVFIELIEGQKEYIRQFKITSPGEYKVVATSSSQQGQIDVDEYQLTVAGDKPFNFGLMLIIIFSFIVIVITVAILFRRNKGQPEEFQTDEHPSEEPSFVFYQK